jgi:DNA-directed RNA polymerase delta subunit
MDGGGPMSRTLLDVCRFILEDQGEPQSSDWLTSQAEEMKLWRASEGEIRRALNKDIENHGESSLFVKVGEDEYALRSWTVV